MKGEIEVGNLSEIGLNLISNSVCAIVSKLMSTQNCEYEIWRKKMRRKICTDLQSTSTILSLTHKCVG
jgi:hypothetical protein